MRACVCATDVSTTSEVYAKGGRDYAKSVQSCGPRGSSAKGSDWAGAAMSGQSYASRELCAILGLVGIRTRTRWHTQTHTYTHTRTLHTAKVLRVVQVMSCPCLQVRDALGCHISGLIADTADEEDEQAEPSQRADVRCTHMVPRTHTHNTSGHPFAQVRDNEHFDIPIPADT